MKALILQFLAFLCPANLTFFGVYHSCCFFLGFLCRLTCPVKHLRSSKSLPAFCARPTCLSACSETVKQQSTGRWAALIAQTFCFTPLVWWFRASGRLICCPTLWFYFPANVSLELDGKYKHSHNPCNQSDCRSYSHCLKSIPRWFPSPSGFKSELKFSGVYILKCLDHFWKQNLEGFFKYYPL